MKERNHVEKKNTLLQMYNTLFYFFHNFTWAFEETCDAMIILANRGQRSTIVSVIVAVSIQG